MFYFMTILGIILYLINCIKAIVNKEEEDYRISYILYSVVIIYVLINILFAYKNAENEQNYIQNIETKLNIYEQSYINYAIEDSLRQVNND